MVTRHCAFPLTGYYSPQSTGRHYGTIPLSKSIHLKEIMVEKVSTEGPFVWVNMQAFLKNQEHVQVVFKNTCLHLDFFFLANE